VERAGAQVDGMSHDDGWRIQGHQQSRPFLSEFAQSAQGSSCHQNSVKHMSDMYKYIHARKSDEI
jgi:hypothetical protein